MRRREFIALASGAAIAWPLAARAQPAGMRRIGVLSPTAADDPQDKIRLAAFQQRLQQLGWTDGHNVRIDYRFAAANLENYHKYAAEFRDVVHKAPRRRVLRMVGPCGRAEASAAAHRGR
jgi:putative ABC transport system substrate-binding protein